MNKYTLLISISFIFLFTGDFLGKLNDEEKQRKKKPIMEAIQPKEIDVIGLYGGDEKAEKDKYIIVRTPKPNRMFYIISIDSIKKILKNLNHDK